jgi:hypothetical protein
VLILKRASASRSSGQWSDDNFHVLANGVVVGRIFKANATPVGSPWMWTLASGTTTIACQRHGYAATREAAMSRVPTTSFRVGARIGVGVGFQGLPVNAPLGTARPSPGSLL